MKRRDFIAGAGGVLVMPPRTRAQSRGLPLVVYLTGIPLNDRPKMFAALRNGLERQGFRYGESISMDFVTAQGRDEKLREIVNSIVDRRPALIMVNGPAPARAVAQSTRAIPIVFVTGADPVKLGLVSSINNPGGNVTGVSILTGDLNPKRLQLIHEIVPRATRIAVVANPSNPVSESQINDVEQASRERGLQVTINRASADGDIAIALDRIAALKVDALLVNADPLFTSRRARFIEFAAKQGLPAIYPVREFTEEGGLVSYGTSLNAANQLAGEYAGRILKGESPGDLPVQLSSRFELVLNAKTAKALGIELPVTLLATADEVIE